MDLGYFLLKFDDGLYPFYEGSFLTDLASELLDGSSLVSSLIRVYLLFI